MSRYSKAELVEAQIADLIIDAEAPSDFDGTWEMDWYKFACRIHAVILQSRLDQNAPIAMDAYGWALPG